VAIIERSDRHEDAQLHDLVPVTERPIDHQHDNDYMRMNMMNRQNQQPLHKIILWVEYYLI